MSADRYPVEEVLNDFALLQGRLPRGAWQDCPAILIVTELRRIAAALETISGRLPV